MLSEKSLPASEKDVERCGASPVCCPRCAAAQTMLEQPASAARAPTRCASCAARLMITGKLVDPLQKCDHSLAARSHHASIHPRSTTDDANQLGTAR